MTSDRFQRLFAQWIAAGGFLMLLPGTLVALGACLFSMVIAVDGSSSPSAIVFGLVAWTVAAVLLGGGLVALIHATRARRNAPTRPMALRVDLLILIATGCSLSAVLLPAFPPLILVTAMAGPMAALAWFTKPHSDALTWRRGLVAIAGGASISITLALALTLLLGTGIAALAPALTRPTVTFDIIGLADFSLALSYGNPAGALAGLALFTVLWPAVIEAVKPLIALPRLHRMDRRESFLTGAAIGAGVAMIETALSVCVILLAMRSYTPGPALATLNMLLLLSAGTGLVHAFCSGLMTVAWRECLMGARPCLPDWLKRYGIAVSIHGLWNVGSAITIAAAVTLTSSGRMSGTLAASAVALAVALLGLLAGLAWWGRRIVASGPTDLASGTRLPELALPPVRAALAGTAVIVLLLPAGIALVQLITLAR